LALDHICLCLFPFDYFVFDYAFLNSLLLPSCAASTEQAVGRNVASLSALPFASSLQPHGEKALSTRDMKLAGDNLRNMGSSRPQALLIYSSFYLISFH
jgi:hypothetical protein